MVDWRIPYIELTLDYMYENYYIRFALLIIIDIVITKLYKLSIEQQISAKGIL